MAQTRSARRDTVYPADGHPSLVLGVTIDPRRDKARIIGMNGGFLAPDLYSWILASPDFIEWRRGKKKRLLWIQGDTGTGKTTQLCGIINDLEKAAPRTVNNVGFVSFFFCQGTDSRSNNATAVLRGLIQVLVQQHPSLCKHIYKRRRHSRAEDSADSSSTWTALSDVFSYILQDQNLRRRGACFVIDALDECETGMSDLLDLVVRTTESPHVKWIVASRSPPQTEERLQTALRRWGTIELPLQSSPDAVSATVGAYVQHTVRELVGRNEYDAVTEAAIRDHLVSTDEAFLWTALVCRGLASIPQSDALEYLRACPHGLDSLYAHTAQKIEESGNGEICKRVLALATAAHGPITLQELCLFLKGPDDSTESANVDHRALLADVVRRCCAFLTLHDGTVYFTRSSGKAFLLSNLTALDDGAFATRVHEANSTIFSKSLEIMSQTLRRDIYRLQHLGSAIDQVRKPDPDPLAAVRYSCIYWVDHLLDANKDSESGDPVYGEHVVHTFLREKYLYWIEGLSLLRCIPEGVRTMEKLEAFLKRLESPRPDFLELVIDARKFVVAHGSVIAFAPLQTYASALVFSPAGSLIKELFKEHEPGWITQSPATDSPESHSAPVWTVAFSPANLQGLAASASDDKTLKIWDVTTGTCIRTLHGHEDLIWSFAFSCTGDQIASASDDGTVRIWQVNTGRCIQTLDGHGDATFSKALSLRGAKGHGDEIWGVAFSHNGEQIVSCSRDRAIKVWDTATGECLQTLMGHLDAVRVVTFWENNTIASGSFDGSVKIWDVKSGTCVQTLKDLAGTFSVVFSHDGQRLASSSDQIQIWDTSTWKCLHTLGSTGQATFSIAYSSNDAMVASASENGRVRIWDPLTGRQIRELKPHAGSPHAGRAQVVAFSRNCQMLASSSELGAIEIWDVGSGAHLRTLTHGTTSIDALAFARADHQLVSISGDGTISIWSMKSGICLQNFKGSNRGLITMVLSHNCQQLATAGEDFTINIWDVVYGTAAWSASFSNNGESLATCSSEGAVRVWDVATGNCRRVFHDHTDAVYATAFSHNDQFLAAASDDRTISIWKMARAYLFQKLRGHRGGVWAVAFSPDDLQIASAANDRTVRVWEVLTGECLQVINIDASLSSISFDPTGSYLRTDLGRIKLVLSGNLLPPSLPSDSTPKPTNAAKETGTDADKGVGMESSSTIPVKVALGSDQHGYGVSADRCWITDNCKNILWLPPEYRPLSVAVSELSICIGCRSGRVLFFGFSGT